MTIERGTTASPFRRPMVVIGVPSDTDAALAFDVDGWSVEQRRSAGRGLGPRFQHVALSMRPQRDLR
jgi:hypothetical protein